MANGIERDWSRLIFAVDAFYAKHGYAIARPSATAQTDTEVVSLPGPDGLFEAGPALPPGVLDGTAFAWSFLCPSAAEWTPRPSTGSSDAACGTLAPVRARLSFALDPWGRLNGAIADEPDTKRYNARWNKLAINMVGTKVLDCSKASDPLGCYSQPFLRYSLSSEGPSWVTDSDHVWRLLGVPVGQVEGAKALASEQWIDPLVTAWSKPFISAIARTELTERPFGSAYSLEFEIAPEVILSHIERVQVLIGSDYWVSQK